MTSLRARLVIGLLLSLVVMIGLLWLTAGESVRVLMEEQLASRLEHDGESLLGGIRITSNGRITMDQRRIQGIYQQPFSGHYYQVSVAGQVIRSRSLWDEILQVPDVDVGETHVSFITGPQQQPLLLWSRGFRKQGRLVSVAVAEELEAMQAGFRRFRWRLAAWSLAVVFILLLIQQYIVVRSLRPVSAAADEITQLEQGEISTLHEQVPDEVRPLVRAINTLLQRQQQRLKRSREALGNLAHAIRTPLTLMQQLASDHVPAGDEDREQLNHYSRQVNELMDKSLRQARLAGDNLGASQFDLEQDLPVLIDTLSRLHSDRKIGFHSQLDGCHHLPLEQQDGMELLGNVLDNAWKWAESTVQLNISGSTPCTIIVEDDGPGIDQDGLQALVQRGARQDESIPGHGIGLSIVKSLVEDLGGRIEFTRSEQLGGLKVSIQLK